MAAETETFPFFFVRDPSTGTVSRDVSTGATLDIQNAAGTPIAGTESSLPATPVATGDTLDIVFQMPIGRECYS